MIDVVTQVTVPFAAGLALGAFYFGGLWLTLRELTRTERPALLIVGSYFGRIAAAAAVLYLVAVAGQWQWLFICLAGFLLVRAAMVRRLRPARLRPRTRRQPIQREHPQLEVEDGDQS